MASSAAQGHGDEFAGGVGTGRGGMVSSAAEFRAREEAEEAEDAKHAVVEGPVRMLLVGAGSRGKVYARYAEEKPHLLKVVGVAEPRPYKRGLIATAHKIPEDNVFESWEAAVKRDKFADCVVIATQDRMHCEPAVAFAAKGYSILLEKPMAVTVEECQKIVDAVKANKVVLGVCHVMRYTPYTQKLKQLIQSGIIGDVVSVQHLEPIGHWHFAHSYVRGNWSKEETSSSMLMAKCCHDVDFLRYLVGVPCEKVSSFGSLFHFRPERRPEGAADRCLDCPVEADCVYSAKKIYLDRAAMGYTGFPLHVLVDSEVNVETITEALRTGPYGRCAWACGNDVMDNQVVNMQFAGGKTASLTTTAFTEAVCVRHTRVFGTLGELDGNGEDTIVHHDFTTGTTSHVRVDAAPESTKMQGHGGADYYLMRRFVRAIRRGDQGMVLSGPDETLESHMTVFAAEHARVHNTVVNVQEFMAAAAAGTAAAPTA